MSNDQTPNVPAERDRREAVREKAQQVKARQARLRVLRRSLIGVGAAAVVAVGAVAVTYAVSSNGSRPQALPAAATDDGFLVSSATGVPDPLAPQAVDGDASTLAAGATPEPATTPTPAPTSTAAPVDIRVYVDYLSTEAREFQVANAEQLSKWVDEDAAKLTYYPVAMLTSKSNGTKYSLRAAGASACVATHASDRFFAFNHELLTNQPAVDSEGYSDQQLADMAQGAGVSDVATVRSCIEDETYTGWAKAATDRAIKGLPDTKGLALTTLPTVLVNGTPYVGHMDDPKEFAQFVLTIDSNAYYSTATPTPTPSATPTATPAG
ncbi:MULTISPECIES: thioredoxin domain-containing protein [Microbacterium]|uniref:DsbA family protein n=1 Tax=Microbacterium TaxID=33882 RepID=UPI0027832C62|nr:MULTISPECIES: thioredoxin domain-containing protein [Microbacterium]MDQ1076262.1 protein-disulfide isomerase [Microbacterium sp. SORGH_AS_0969]MDQ1116499.1 protein-disulfide isomerase [Microbacterium testaceum]